MHYLIFIPALLACIATAQATPLGRLFFTPEERAAMDRERLKIGMPGTATTEAAVPTAIPETVTLNGHIKRGSGKSTVWLNGRPQYESDAPNPITVTVTEKKHAPEEIAVTIPGTNRTYPLKVGQTLDSGSGEIRESYQPAPQFSAQSANKNSQPTAARSDIAGRNSVKK